MGLLSWIVVGSLAGLFGRRIVGDHRQGCIYTVVVGVIGAIVGGWLMSTIGEEGVDDVSIRSIVVAAVGAVLLLLVLEAVSGVGPRGRRRR